MNIIILFLVYNFLYGFLDFFYKKKKIVKKKSTEGFSPLQNEELFRKIAHIGTGIITFFSLDYLVLTDYGILVILFLVEFIFIRKYDLVKFMTTNKRGYGDIYFILGQGILIGFMNYNIIFTKIGLLILTLSDGLAPFGKNIFRFKIFKKKIYKQKTLGGSLMFFLISLVILFFYLGFCIKIFLLALFLTIIELISFRGLDNVLLPIFTILILYFLI